MGAKPTYEQNLLAEEITRSLLQTTTKYDCIKTEIPYNGAQHFKAYGEIRQIY